MPIKYLELFTAASPEVRTPRKEGGKPYSCIPVQGMATDDKGVQHVFADLLFADRGPDGKPVPLQALPAGKYFPRFSVNVDFQTRRIVARLVGLRPLLEAAREEVKAAAA